MVWVPASSLPLCSLGWNSWVLPPRSLHNRTSKYLRIPARVYSLTVPDDCCLVTVIQRFKFHIFCITSKYMYSTESDISIMHNLQCRGSRFISYLIRFKIWKFLDFTVIYFKPFFISRTICPECNEHVLYIQ